ncbi:hypothetical protein Q5752_000375 [Cryptotrichosporon argae]
MSRPASVLPSAAATPAPSSPPPSESYLSDLDGSASVLETSYGDVAWEPPANAAALNLVTWKLDVHARVVDGVDKRGFNAISTVLNHPTKKANPLRGTRKPLPPLSQPPPLLPKPVPPSHYEPYLQSITPAYDAFVAAQGSSSFEFDSRLPEPASSDLPPLDTIPAVFFEPAFDLAKPSTWADVVGPADVGEGLQDDLSTYLDTLERHLAHEITLRSSAFFSALSNLQDLHAESASCLSRIGELRAELTDVGSKQARRGLEVIEAQERLRGLRVTEAGVKRVAEVDELLRVAKGLADGGVWEGALGCVEDIVRWWEAHDPPLADLPLSTLPALTDLPATVSDLTRAIAVQLEAVLKSLLGGVFARPETDEPDTDAFSGAIKPVLAGLVRCGRREVVDTVWKEVVAEAVRQGSRKHLPVSQGDDDADHDGRQVEARGQSLAQALQGMDHAQFLALSTQMYASLLHRIRLAQCVGDVLSAVLEEVQSLPALAIARLASAVPATPKPVEPAAFDAADVVSQACELANTRASKILAVRSEQHAALSLEHFVEVFRESWHFVVTTETLARRMIVSLRGVATSQARAYLISYHGQRLTRSAKLVEEETWVQVDVPAPTQHIVNLLVDAAVGDPGECFIPPHSAANGTGTGDGSAAAAGKQVLVEDKPFFVVNATSETLALLGDYLKIVINLEIVVTDVMSRIIEFLKSFNSRTCQVVLGAGAMRSAGLKNITAKHLALASQSLSAVVTLIPYIREFIRRHLNPKQAVMLVEFDKLRRDYQEHQNEIHAKLVAIMADRLAVHCASLREIDWEAQPAKDGPRQYAEMLVKETATLHKVLSKYLAQQTVEVVMSQVLAAIVHRLSDEYAKVEFKSDDAKRRMAQDVALIAARLQPLLTDATSPVGSLETLVRDKPTPRRPVGQAVRGLLRRQGSKDVEARSVADKIDADDDDDDDAGEALTDPDAGGASTQPGEPGARTVNDPDVLDTAGAPATPSKRADEADVPPEIADTPAPPTPAKDAAALPPPETPSKGAASPSNVVPASSNEEAPSTPSKEAPVAPSAEAEPQMSDKDEATDKGEAAQETSSNWDAVSELPSKPAEVKDEELGASGMDGLGSDREEPSAGKEEPSTVTGGGEAAVDAASAERASVSPKK